MDATEAEAEEKNDSGYLSKNRNYPKEEEQFDLPQIKKELIDVDSQFARHASSPSDSPSDENIINGGSAGHLRPSSPPSSSFHVVNCRQSTPSTRLPESVLSIYNSMAGLFYHSYCQTGELPLKNELSLETSVDSNHFPPSMLAAASLLKMCYPNKSEEEPQEIDIHECRWTRCVKKFNNLDKLVSHVNEQHVRTEQVSGEYRCGWNGCQRLGKGFNARYKMLVHIRTHTNEKPHKCPLCGKCFSRLENLKIHNRSHTGEKPYVCPVDGCYKAYSNSSDRFKHVRTHQEEKPYICKASGCSKRYTDPSSLRKHVRTHGHYFANKEVVSDGNMKPSIQESLNYDSRTFALPASYLLSSKQRQSLTSVQNEYIPLSRFFVDPFLSSSILNSANMIHESPSKDLNSGLASVLRNKKNDFDMEAAVIDHENYQDSPLDLTVCSSQSEHDDSSSFHPASIESVIST